MKTPKVTKKSPKMAKNLPFLIIRLPGFCKNCCFFLLNYVLLHLENLYSIEVILTMILTLKVPALCYFFLWNPFVRTKFSVIDQCKYKETNTMQFWNYMYVYICVCFDFTSSLVSLCIKHKLNTLEPIKIYKSHNYDARIVNREL